MRATLRVTSEDTEDEGVVTRVSLELSLAGLATQPYDGDYVRGAARASREAREAREAEREARVAHIGLMAARRLGQQSVIKAWESWAQEYRTQRRQVRTDPGPDSWS